MVLGAYILFFTLLGVMPSSNESASPHSISSTLRVGVYDNPPKLVASTTDAPKGIFVDVIQYVAKKENLNIQFIQGDWFELIKKLEKGEIDLLPDVAYSAERDSLFQFNRIGVLDSWLEIFVTQANVSLSLDNISGKRMGVLKESIQDQYARTFLNNQLNLNLEIVPYESYASSTKALMQGEIDALLAGRFFEFSPEYESTIASTGLVFRPTSLLFAFSKTISPTLITRFDHHLTQLKNNPNSTYYTSLDHWLDYNHTHSNTVNESIKRVLVIVVYLLVVAGIFLIVLQQQIKSKTKLLKVQNEELTLAKRKAEESDRLKSVFLQNMSHEIRTPMNGILGFLDLLKDHDLNDDTKNEFIDIINQSGQRLLTTVNDIIEISKIESDQVTLQIAPISLTELFTFHERFFKPKAKSKGIELEISMDVPLEQAFIDSDQNLLDSIFTNLLNNALKFTHKGIITFGCTLKEERLVFFVKDTGIGILPDRQEAIFQPFVQADLNISRSHEGAGLGLSIVKGYVSLLEGELKLESETGKGTTFYISLPIVPYTIKSETKDTATSPSIHIKPTSILIAEDDYVSYLYIKNILKDQPVTLLHAANGKQAIDLMKSHQNISLILMDIKMPVMNGFEATKIIRETNPNIPIIAQTAYAMAEDKAKVLDSGCTDYISKPIRKVDLLQLIIQYT